MSDNKKWFKVWASILIDPGHRDMTLEDVGRWCRLGAYLVASGENGKIKIVPPATSFVSAMGVPDIKALLVALKRLPNVSILDCLSVNGDFIVTMKNWYKYQVDSTSGERVKRIRHKRRGEERRGEVDVKGNFSTSPSPPATRDVATLDATQRPLAGNDKQTAGGPNARNEELRGTGILEQVAKRRRAQGLEKL